MAELPPRPEGIALAHFIVTDDLARSRRFYTEVLGGRVVFSGPGGPTQGVALANTWIVINRRRRPDRRQAHGRLETPRELDRVSSFLNIRVKDIAAALRRLERARRAAVPDAAEAAPLRDPLLHPRPRRPSDRGRPDHGPRRGLDAGSLAIEARPPRTSGAVTELPS